MRACVWSPPETYSSSKASHFAERPGDHARMWSDGRSRGREGAERRSWARMGITPATFVPGEETRFPLQSAPFGRRVGGRGPASEVDLRSAGLSVGGRGVHVSGAVEV